MASIRLVAGVPFLVLLLAAVMAPALDSGFGSSEPVAGPRVPICAQLIDVPGIGAACPDGAGWKVPLADGSWVYTHGPDPIPTFLFDSPDAPRTVEEVIGRLDVPEERAAAHCVGLAQPHG